MPPGRRWWRGLPWGSKSTDRTRLRAPCGLRSVEADLTAESIDLGQAVGRKQTIAPGFQQAEGEILQRAEAAREGLLEQTARQHQLKEEVGHLQQKVKDLGGRVVLAVGVLEGEAAVLLRVEPLVLDLPAQASRILGEFTDLVAAEVEVGDPEEARGPA